MALAHNLGLPRIGLQRETKSAVENYWQGKINQTELHAIGKKIRATNWGFQIAAGHDFLSVGDFSWYDQVLDMSVMLGVIPDRFKDKNNTIDIDTYFRMARGRAPTGTDAPACEMTKWFDTNYHYIVPEFSPKQNFAIMEQKLFSEVAEALLLGPAVKPILLGPLSYLWLGKCKTHHFDKLNLLPALINVYQQIFQRLQKLGVSWVQIDEPILVLDLPSDWQAAYRDTYQKLRCSELNLLLTTYFAGLENNCELACQLPTAGLHIDAIRAPEQLQSILSYLPAQKILSVGIIDGRNIWRTDLRRAFEQLHTLHKKLGERLWVGSSCSLLHCPLDLDQENKLDAELKTWLAFAKQKLHEIAWLTQGLNQGEASIGQQLRSSDEAIAARKNSPRIHNATTKQACQNITESMTKRPNEYAKRNSAQKSTLNLPLFPTTTIGSFPQTSEIRILRRDFKSGAVATENYHTQIRQHIKEMIRKQEACDLDVLVHGEAERNDMVEYFGELLEGFAFTKHGWVQSYGSRCVKPPIIFGDVSRPKQMTVDWITYAQSLTAKPVKGMLTGPMTILCWSFVRDDQPRFTTAKQIALALREEVNDLVTAGIKIIQIDEPAFREGLPLQKKYWQNYLKQAVDCFRLSSCGVPDHIQIHTHMCYSEFNDIIETIAELDADVITIETSRSDMELLQAFERFDYPNEIGPGVYDIHSPLVPAAEDIITLLEKAANHIPIQRLWINPDCGLKTREWSETEAALKTMVAAAKQLREKYQAV